MFKKPTVFILGAGASWHYGYPTGEDLVEQIIEKAKCLEHWCQDRLRTRFFQQHIPEYVGSRPGPIDSSFDQVRNEAGALASRLQSVRPLVIDYFLGWNPSLQPLGKLLIAAVMLECEATYLSTRTNINRRKLLTDAPLPPENLRGLNLSKYKDDWIRFVTHRLVYGCEQSSDLLQNQVIFITFNYDGSLENRLYESLMSIDLFGPNDITRFLGEKPRFIHVYGSVHKRVPAENPPIDGTVAAKFGKVSFRLDDRDDVSRATGEVQFLDRALEASQGIRTIDPHDKSDEVTLAAARDAIQAAECIYILGFGFDRRNCERLGVQPDKLQIQRGQKPKRILFTNYGDINRINREASKAFLGYSEAFLTTQILNHRPDGGHYFEKSVRNCYDALALDFDDIETT